MSKHLTRLGFATLLTTTLAATAGTGAEIKDNKEIFRRLLTAAIGHEIQEKCPTIEVRTLAATFYVLGIVNYAMQQGFSRAEMDIYRNDPKEQDRLRAATYVYLDKHGVNRAIPASHCLLGMTEIAQNTETGKLLKSR